MLHFQSLQEFGRFTLPNYLYLPSGQTPVVENRPSTMGLEVTASMMLVGSTLQLTCSEHQSPKLFDVLPNSGTRLGNKVDDGNASQSEVFCGRSATG